MKCLPKVFLFLSSWHCPLTQKQDWKWCCKQFPAGFCGYESRGQSSSSFFLMGNWHIGPLCVGIHNVFSQSSDLAKSKKGSFLVEDFLLLLLLENESIREEKQKNSFELTCSIGTWDLSGKSLLSWKKEARSEDLKELWGSPTVIRRLLLYYALQFLW